MSRWAAEGWGEARPVTWWRGYPVYCAHVVAAALVAAMLATTVALFAGAGGFLRALGFSSSAVLNGELWRILSYGVVNPPSVSFALEVVMLVWFEIGRAHV